MEVEIKKLVPEDWESYKNLRLKALEDFPTAWSRSPKEEIRRSEEYWRGKLTYPNVVYGAKQEEELVGVVGLEFYSGERTKHKTKLWGVFVSPEFHGNGVAARILEKVVSDLKSNPQIIKIDLNVSETQTGAQKLYEKFGFKKVGVLGKEVKINGKFYDQYIMEMILDKNS